MECAGRPEKSTRRPLHPTLVACQASSSPLFAVCVGMRRNPLPARLTRQWRRIHAVSHVGGAVFIFFPYAGEFLCILCELPPIFSTKLPLGGHCCRRSRCCLCSSFTLHSGQRTPSAGDIFTSGILYEHITSSLAPFLTTSHPFWRQNGASPLCMLVELELPCFHSQSAMWQ